eukprot:GILK01001396.1.p1 GENE.GILK01001396.1~~GILK01001396.1.p1  ORF type:complete len:819 (+),score=146.71 GILK01001396.1:35-2458(+)
MDVRVLVGTLLLCVCFGNADEDVTMIPGTDFIGSGYDSVTEQYTLPLFQINFNDGYVWTDSETGKKYFIPNDFFVRDTPEFHDLGTNTLYREESEFLREEVHSSYSFGTLYLPYVSLSYSFSKTKGQLTEIFKSHTRQMMYGEKYFGMFELTVLPIVPLDPRFLMRIKMLPNSRDSEDDRHAYTRFISDFGTHYISSGMFGGSVNFTSIFDVSLTQTHSEEWIQQQASIGIEILQCGIGLKAGESKDEATKKMNMDFFKYNERVMESLGGDAIVLEQGNYTAWEKSVFDKPGLLHRHSKYIALFELIDDPVKRKLMQDAVMDYGNKPFTALNALAADPFDLPTIPGAESEIGVGFDAATLEMKLPVVQMSYSHDSACAHCTFTYPGYPDMVYKVPQQVYATPDTSSELINMTIVFKDVREYERYHEEHHSSSGFLGFGKKSTTIIDYYYMFYQQDYLMSQTIQYHQWYSMTLLLLPPPPLYPAFDITIQRLPHEYDDAVYRRLILNFGTHYVSKSYMGGKINATFEFHRCLLTEHSEHWVEKQSSWSFFGIVGSGHHDASHGKDVDTKFWEYSAKSVDLFGGYADKFQADEWSGWVNTIKFAPRAIKTEIRPIWELISDEVVAANVQKSVMTYMIEAENAANALAAELAKHDPRTEPAWCKSPPPPPMLMSKLRRNQHQNGAIQELPYQTCRASNVLDTVRVHSVLLDASNRESLKLLLEGGSLDRVEGGQVEMITKFRGVRLASSSFNFCEEHAEDVTCVVSRGIWTIGQKMIVPSAIPKGTYNIELFVKDRVKAVLGCVSFDLEL